jgi:hypothetical protein
LAAPAASTVAFGGEQVTTLKSLRELHAGHFHGHYRFGFAGRPTISLAAYREIKPVKPRSRFLKELHESPPLQPARKQLAYVPLIWSKEQPNHSHRHRMQEDVSSILASAQAVGEKWKHAGWVVAGGL